MALTHDDLEILRERFPVEDHEFLNERAYITESAITTRIEDVDPSWEGVVIGKPDIRESAGNTLAISVLFRLTINGVSRDGIGMAQVQVKRGYKKDGKYVTLPPEEWAEVNEAEKSAATDALKRAARLFGIGRYLLSLPKTIKDPASLKAYFHAGVNAPPRSIGSNVPESKGKLSERGNSKRPTFADKPDMWDKMLVFIRKEGLDDFDLLEALNLANLDALMALPCDDTGRAAIKAAIAIFNANKAAAS